jgi:hypothetical protein
MQRDIAKWVRLGLTLLVLVSCTQAKPSWIKKDTHAYLNKRTFYGVGTLSGVKIKNKILAQITSENLAKAEVAKIFDAYTLSLLDAYTASLTVDQRADIEDMGELKMTFMTHGAMTLFDSVVEETWTDPDKGTYHALAKIKLKTFLREIASAEDLTPQFQNFIKKNAQDYFDRLKGLNETETQEKS